MMRMTFYVGYDSVILIDRWKTSDIYSFTFACVVLIIVSFTTVYIRKLRMNMKTNNKFVLPSSRDGNTHTHTYTIHSSQQPLGPKAHTGSSYYMHSQDTQTASPPTTSVALTHDAVRALNAHTHTHTEPKCFMQATSHTHQDWGYQTILDPQTHTQSAVSHVIGFALIFVSLFIEWCLMLACMTFNFGIFVSVILGFTVGHLVIKLPPSQTFMQEACH